MLDTTQDTQARMDHIRRDLVAVREDFAKLGNRSVKVASGTVQDRPIGALLIAFAIGFLGGRLL